MHVRLTKAGFSLVEIVAVVVLLAILAAGSIAGLRVQRDNANLRQVTQALSAIDQAKQNWRLFHNSDTWPSDEPSRWLLVQGSLNSTATGFVCALSGYSTYNSYDRVTPNNYYFQIGDEGSPSSAIYWTGSGPAVVVTRPLN